jgi:DNA-binding response OmpR family regulator
VKRILVVEDDPDMGRILAFALRKGFDAEVDVVADGATGIEHARAHAYDLIVCDMMLPGADGLEVLRQLRRVEPVVDVPFVFVTAAVESTFGRRRPQDLGACGVIHKPVDIRQLCPRIKAMLEEAGASGL